MLADSHYAQVPKAQDYILIVWCDHNYFHHLGLHIRRFSICEAIGSSALLCAGRFLNIFNHIFV